jgi:hypothetical protein
MPWKRIAKIADRASDSGFPFEYHERIIKFVDAMISTGFCPVRKHAYYDKR